MIRRQPVATGTATTCPYTTLFRSLQDLAVLRNFVGGAGVLTLFDSPWVPLYLAVVYLLSPLLGHVALAGGAILFGLALVNDLVTQDRKSTRLKLQSLMRNSYAVFCLKTKKKIKDIHTISIVN